MLELDLLITTLDNFIDQTPYLNVVFGQKVRSQRLLQTKRSRDEDEEVQDLAVLKRIKRAAESIEKRAVRLNEAAGNLYSSMA